MKVYYVANVRMPNERGHGIQLAKMCEAFIEAGVDLELIAPYIPKRSQNNMQDYYGLRVPVPVRFLPVLYLGNSRLAFHLRSLSFAIVSLAYLFFRLRRARLSSVIYTIDLDQFSFAPLPVLGAPVFFEVHGSKRTSFFARFFLKRVKGVVAVSQGVAANLSRAFGINAPKLMVAPNGIDFKVFDTHRTLPRAEAREELSIPKNRLIFLYVGKFYDWKGLEILPKVARLLPDISIYVVGGTEQEFKKETQTPDIPPNLVIVGAVEHQEIPLWMSAADFFLLTGTSRDHYSFYETSPMKLFEYLGARRPIIAARTPAIASLVSDDEVLFYNPDDTHDLVHVMGRAVKDLAMLSTQVEQGFVRVQQFSWENRARQILSMVQKSI